MLPPFPFQIAEGILGWRRVSVKMDQWELHAFRPPLRSDSNTRYYEKIFSVQRVAASPVRIEFRGEHRVAWIKHSEIPDDWSASQCCPGFSAAQPGYALEFRLCSALRCSC